MIQRGERRYIPKVWSQSGRTSLWGVYDRELGSWPRHRPGIGDIMQETDEETANAEADRMEETR